LSDFYRGKDDHEAFNYLKIATEAKDSMSSSDKLRQAQILLFNEQVREKEKAEAEAKEAARKRLIIVVVAIIISIISFLIWNRLRQLRLRYKAILEQKESEKLKVEYNLKKVQMERQIVELEAKALRAQMNPHFIFNCMNSIKALIQKNENEKAADYLTTFSKLIRTIFQNSDKREISLFDEVETCRLYTQLESLRFGDKLSYSFEVDETIDLKSIMVPALILQPFIENAIWHGIMPKENTGVLHVNISKKEDKIYCVVEDNGIGRELSMQNKFKGTSSTHQSKGVRLTQSRLELNNMLNQRNATVEIIDKTNGEDVPSGTKVTLTLAEE
jgi:LytS/YehU family sensor histidine kinase